MALPEPLRSFWYQYESLGSALVHTPWGVVATDPRFPRIYDANHAGVVHAPVELTLEDIRAELMPAVREAGCVYEHIEFMDTDDDCRALRDLREALPQVTADALMVFEGERLPGPSTEAPVGEVTDPDEDFWRLYRDSRAEFGEDMDAQVLDELIARDRQVFVPAGLRTFTSTVDGETAGFASLLSLSGVGYIDNVVTLPAFRRRGIASSTVAAAVTASIKSGDAMTFLFAIDGGAPQRLYERLGFRTRVKAIGFTRPIAA